MQNKIKALLFDLTEDNLNAHEIEKVNITSGRNLLENIKFDNGKLIDTPFLRLIEVEGDTNNIPYSRTISIEDEQLSDILKIDKKNLFFYKFYGRIAGKSRSRTWEAITSLRLRMLANKEMLKQNKPIFEMRVKMRKNDEWSSWQAVAGKFIIFDDNPSGVAQIYSSITEKIIETFTEEYQIRYSGNIFYELMMEDSLPRISTDPFSRDIRKIIDPNDFSIFFDSQVIQDYSMEKVYEAWKVFEERYR